MTRPAGAPNVFRWESFDRLPLVGILRGFDPAQVRQLVPAAAEGGLCNFEVTMNTAGAAALISDLPSWAGDRANIGAGTVCSLDDLEAALAAGASFIVTPTVVADVIVECARRRVPVFAGAFAPTEMHRAFELGASLVKVFPSEVGGPGYIRALRGPFPGWRLMPTGGVTVETLPAYKQAGAAAFGVGSPLFSPQRAAAGDWDWVREQARRFARALCS